jgi:hypothetical protein
LKTCAITEVKLEIPLAPAVVGEDGTRRVSEAVNALVGLCSTDLNVFFVQNVQSKPGEDTAVGYGPRETAFVDDGSPCIENTVVHEAGHSLAPYLSHTNEREDLMFDGPGCSCRIPLFQADRLNP